jgi:hypothetical protein
VLLGEAARFLVSVGVLVLSLAGFVLGFEVLWFKSRICLCVCWLRIFPSFWLTQWILGKLIPRTELFKSLLQQLLKT